MSTEGKPTKLVNLKKALKNTKVSLKKKPKAKPAINPNISQSQMNPEIGYISATTMNQIYGGGAGGAF